MRIYACPVCSHRVFFDNLTCVCGLHLAYDPHADEMASVFAPCANRAQIDCNWVADGAGALCRACAMTRTHPDVALPETRLLWSRAEAAKRWVLVNLARLGWFTEADPGPRPVFDLLGEATRLGPTTPVMGHTNGEITINVAEADRVELVARREQMGEPYRTMIGHFRHEIAHFLFLRLSVGPDFLGRFRTLFGDERSDYGAALRAHYGREDDGSWQERHISHYASAHPHEDWAESAAHALHLHDLVHSAQAVGVSPAAGEGEIAVGIDLGIALNHINRSMGLDDLYPFVVSPAARSKLAFALEALHRSP